MYDLTAIRKATPAMLTESVSSFLGEDLLRGKNAPCPLCGGTDRARWCKETGRMYCSQCAPKFMSALDLYLEYYKLDFRSGVQKFAAELGVSLSQNVTRNGESDCKVDRILRNCVPLKYDDPYLMHLEKRGLDPNQLIGHKYILHSSQLWHSETNKSYPGMVAQLLSGKKLAKISRLFLESNGAKAAVKPTRKILNKSSGGSGSVVVIGGDRSDMLAIGEGVETMIAVFQATGISTVAACDATNLSQFKPPRFVRKLLVSVDYDRSRRGHQAYHELRARLYNSEQHRHLQCVPVLPEYEGTDWADYSQDEIKVAWERLARESRSITREYK